MILTMQEKKVFAKLLKCNPGVTAKQLVEGYSHNRFHYYAIERPKASYTPALVDISPLSCLKTWRKLSCTTVRFPICHRCLHFIS